MNERYLMLDFFIRFYDAPNIVYSVRRVDVHMTKDVTFKFTN